jgi:steroid delta-isomerase-like uncharacterized protein
MMDTAKLIEEWATAWSDQDVDRVMALFTTDCAYEDVTFAAVQHGHDELAAFGRGFLAGVPDFTIELHSVLADGDRGAAEWTMRGTHTGDLPDLPATGRRFAVRGASIFKAHGGLLTRCSDYWDAATWMRQLT